MLVCVLISAAAVAQAEKPYDTREEERYWNIFLPAKKDTPAEEFEYARELEEKGSDWWSRRHYKAVLKHWPTSPEAPRAQMAIARILDEAGDVKDAFEAYQKLFEKYPGRFPSDKVLERQFELAVEIMNSRKLKLFFGGLSDPVQAIPLFEKIVENAPEWEKAPNSQFLIGKAYEESGKYEMAIPEYQAVELRYTETPLASEAAFRKCKLLVDLSKRYNNDNELRQKAYSALKLFVARNPDSEYHDQAVELKKEQYNRCAKAEFDVGRFYDDISNRPKAALMEYRQLLKEYPESKLAERAETRVAALEKKVEETDES